MQLHFKLLTQISAAHAVLGLCLLSPSAKAQTAAPPPASTPINHTINFNVPRRSFFTTALPPQNRLANFNPQFQTAAERQPIHFENGVLFFGEQARLGKTTRRKHAGPNGLFIEYRF